MKKYELTILKRMMRVKKNEEIFHMNHKFQFSGNTYNGFTNGHYILASKDEDYGFPEAEEPIGIEKLFKDYDDTLIPDWNEKTLDITTIDINSGYAEMVKRFNRENKLPKKAYKIYIKELADGFSRIGVNPIYLLDILKFVGTSEAYIDCDGFEEKTDRYTHTLFFRNEDKSKIGLLAPIRFDAYQIPDKWMIDSNCFENQSYCYFDKNLKRYVSDWFNSDSGHYVSCY